MKNLILLAITVLLSVCSFAQPIDSANVKIKLQFKREHIMLFGYYLQSFDDVTSYDLYSRMSAALVTKDTAKSSTVVSLNISTNEYIKFNEMMGMDRTGEIYNIYNDIVRGSTGYTGLIAQLLTLSTSGTSTQRVGAKFMLKTCNNQTKEFILTKDEKIFKGANYLFSTPAVIIR